MLFGRKVKAEDFEAAALPHANELFRTAVRMMGERAAAEDVVQEVYLQAWKSFHRFAPGTNCRAWLFKILSHVIHHHYRRRGFKWRKVSEDTASLEETLTYEPPIPEHLSDEDILTALQKIPSDFREVVLLSDVQEFSYKEIAQLIEIPVGTVMSRLSRGRALLRMELAQLAASYGIKKAREESPRSDL